MQRAGRHMRSRDVRRERRDRRVPRSRQGSAKDKVCVCLSAATCEWAEAMADPFRALPDATIPLPPAIPSQGVTVFAKGTFATGTGQRGFVAMNPAGMLASNVDAVYASVATYAGTTISQAAPNVGYGSNSPYIAADFGGTVPDGDLQWRIVAAGLRARYVGTELERGGRLFSLSEPDHQNLVGSDQSDLQAYDSCKDDAVTRAWRSALWAPARESDFHYSSTAPASLGSCPMGIIATAPTTTSQTYQWEAWVHAEFIGAKARGKRVRQVDPLGGPAMWDAASTLFGEREAPSAKDLMNEAAANLASAASFVSGVVGNARAAYSAWESMTGGSTVITDPREL